MSFCAASKAMLRNLDCVVDIAACRQLDSTIILQKQVFNFEPQVPGSGYLQSIQ